MANLFWKNELGMLSTLTPSQFKTEEELEKYLLKNPQLLGDLIIISRQTKTGTHHDIPDLIALDADNNVVIIELKRASASEEIIPQVLRYAIWAETNPDSIKNLWLECPDKSDDRQIDWDSLAIKIMIVAEIIPVGVLRLVNRITYPVDLLEVTRFISGKSEFVLVNQRTPEGIPNTSTARGQSVWDEAWYRKNHNSSDVDIFIHTVKEIEKLVKEKGWKLETKFNKSYVALKYGFPNVFGVSWTGSKTLCIFFKVPKDIAMDIKIDKIEPIRYEDAWHEIYFKVESKDYPIERLMPFFEASYRYITGG
jgi:hypothetical protein